MLLNHPIMIQPPPFTDAKGQIVHPKPLEFSVLNVSYVDNPTRKTVFAQIQGIPQPLLLAADNDYIVLGDYTQVQIEQLLKTKLGNDVALTLRRLFPKTLEEHPNGPGTILASMFSSLGIKSSPTCSCRRHAIEMNEKGNDWCEQNLAVILGWLKDESAKRKIPFVESLASLVVKRAIRLSRQKLGMVAH